MATRVIQEVVGRVVVMLVVFYHQNKGIGVWIVWVCDRELPSGRLGEPSAIPRSSSRCPAPHAYDTSRLLVRFMSCVSQSPSETNRLRFVCCVRLLTVQFSSPRCDCLGDGRSI